MPYEICGHPLKKRSPLANPQHIEWILEGVESWNARREQGDFWADLDGANLPALFQGASYSSTSIYTAHVLTGLI